VPPQKNRSCFCQVFEAQIKSRGASQAPGAPQVHEGSAAITRRAERPEHRHQLLSANEAPVVFHARHVKEVFTASSIKINIQDF
jgi:hypothetical protein